MGGVLIVTSNKEDGSLHGSVAALAALAAQGQLKPSGCSFSVLKPESMAIFGSAGLNKIYSFQTELLTIKQKTSFVKKVIAKEQINEIWVFQNKDFAAYLAGSIGGTVFENVSERISDGGNITVKSELYAGKFIAKSKCKNEKPIVISFSSVPEGKASAVTNCQSEMITEVIDSNVNRDGEIKLSAKQEGISLPEARVILDVGDGLGTKGIPTIKKLANILKAMGVKVAIGGSRVVTDAGRLPRNAQIGISGISVQPELIISIGVSGAPQHWAGMHKAKYKVCVNTDANAPLMKMVDYPVVGDGHLFIKEITETLAENLTAEQKEALNKSVVVKNRPNQTNHKWQPYTMNI
jgi:electron transfer flavoprotein alpha subunit